MRIAKPIGLALSFGACVILIVAAPLAMAGFKKSDSKVKIKASAGKVSAAGLQVVTVKIKVDKGWHIYANDPQNEFFDATKTVMKVAGKNVKSVKIQYPKGDVKTTGKEIYRVYKNEVTIKAIVQRTSSVAAPLDVSIRLSACDKDKCLFPATVKLTVK